MRGGHRYELVLGVLLATAFWAVVSVLESDSTASTSIIIVAFRHVAAAIDHVGNTITALATVAIAAFTYTLYTATKRLWEAGEKQLHIGAQSAAAADLSAKAAIGIELPIIRPFVEDIEYVDGPIVGGQSYQSANLKGAPKRYSVLPGISVRNFGRTPAFPVKLEIGWRVTAQLPGTPEYRRTVTFPHDAVIQPDQPADWVRLDELIELTDLQQAALRAGTSSLWVYGAYHFTDFLNLPHEARFCARRCVRDELGVHRFASDGNPPLLYTRKS